MNAANFLCRKMPDQLKFDGVPPLSGRNTLSTKHTFSDPHELLPLSKRLIKI